MKQTPVCFNKRPFVSKVSGLTFCTATNQFYYGLYQVLASRKYDRRGRKNDQKLAALALPDPNNVRQKHVSVEALYDSNLLGEDFFVFVDFCDICNMGKNSRTMA